MTVSETALEGVKIITPRVIQDSRGYFFESWNDVNYKKFGVNNNWVQDNESYSKYGVLRGLHYQLAPYTQAKLVRVIKGVVLDVAVDIRKGSPTFGEHVAVELSGDNKKQLLIPRGFAHGFIVLSDEVIFSYKCDNIYAPECERGILFNDPALGIDWKINQGSIQVSVKDAKNSLLESADVFDYNAKDYMRLNC